MNKITATVVGDSLSPQGRRLTSLELVFPRFILAELNTHRALSKNSASSRAIPFNKMVEMVRENPFIPVAWQKEHKGMQGTEYINEIAAGYAQEAWLTARDRAVEEAEALTLNQVTKQLCNRLLEPFMYHKVLISGTDEGWHNFFKLRCPQYVIDDSGKTYFTKRDCIIARPDIFTKDFMKTMDELDWLRLNRGQAEIHMMALAEAIWDARNESTPEQLQAGEWHIPYWKQIKPNTLNDYWIGLMQEDDENEEKEKLELTIKIATGMAARVSYTTVGDEKEISYKTLIGIHDKMQVAVPFHASPFEHCARAMSDEEYYGSIRGIGFSTVDEEHEDWKAIHEAYPGFYTLPEPQARVIIAQHSKNMRLIHEHVMRHDDPRFGWNRNFRGFIQYRSIIEDGI